MTPAVASSPGERRTTRLTFVLLFALTCQTVRPAEGYPRRESRLELAGSAARPEIESRDISSLIQTAYESHELIRREQWRMRDDNRDATSKPVRQNTSRYHRGASSATGELSPVMSSASQQESATDTSLQSDGKIVFPTDDDEMTYNLRSAPICQGATFCENVAYYPGRLVNEAIGRNDSLKFLASVDAVSSITSVEQRIDASDEMPLCTSVEQLVYPQSAENKRKEWLFVVNQDNFKQGVRIEVCSKEEQNCSVIDGFAEGYRTMCKQKYIYRQLAAVGSDGKVVSDMFRFPSSCCCHIKFTGDPLVRIGLLDERSNQTTSKIRRKK